MILKKLFLNWFVFVYAIYLYFNKGVAYTFLAEITLVVGLLLVLSRYKTFELPWNRRSLVIVVLLAVTSIYMVRGVLRYPFMEVLRDSFMFNYAYFIFIVYLFKDELALVKNRLYEVYKWFPLVTATAFVLRSNIPSLSELTLFGDAPFLVYKHGDMGVHLLITVLFIINGNIRFKSRFGFINLILIGYLFLLTATFNRGGMMAFVMGLIAFLWFSKSTIVKSLLGYLKFAPLVLMIALPLYISTNITDDIQGRTTSIAQLQENVTSLVSSDVGNEVLSSNITWRLLWWGKIIDYTVLGEHFFTGKGLGINLAVDDSIPIEGDALRAPHNFHLNILARFGVPVFLVWVYWLFLMFRRFRSKELSAEGITYLSIMLSFMINASFDVYLEGPMGAMPCWIMIGLGFATEAFQQKPTA
jgi:hypothetical protein